MSDIKKPGSGKIIRTSSGSTRLTAGSSKNESKPAESTGQGQKSGSQGSGQNSGQNSGQGEQKATVVAPPAPKASPKPSRAPSAGSQGSGAGSQGTGSQGSGATGSQGSGATGSQGSGGGRSSGGDRTATSVMGNAANTVRASSGGVKMGVKNMVDNGQGKKKGPRTVRLTVSAVDPWSVMKMSFLMSVAIGIATIVAFIVLWIVLQATGVMSGLESTMSELAGAESAERIVGIFGFGRVVAAGFIIAVINIVLMTALSTLAAFIYNIGSLIAGGFSLTLTDD